MDIITDAQLLTQIEAFLTSNEMSASRFGINVMGDGALVFQLREGKRSLSLKNAAKVVDYMQGYSSDTAQAAVCTLCSERLTDVTLRACTDTGCPHVGREAA